MAGKIRFIHSADIHLGSILKITGNIPGDKEQLFKKATLNAFERICSAAIKYNVDFLLLAGDVYDQESRSVMANHFFNKQCNRLNDAGISIYMIGGNHDPAADQDELLELPENVTLFSSEQVEMREVRDKEGKTLARVLGQSYRGASESRKMYRSFSPPDTGVWNIGLLHTQLDPSNNNYVPCTIDDLSSRGDIHYWALGHLHQDKVYRRDEQLITYPGIPQGRDPGEDGIGGCFMVDLVPGQSPRIQFIPVSSVIWRNIQVSIEDEIDEPPKNITELEKLLREKAEEVLDRSPLATLGEDIPVLEGNWAKEFKGYVNRWILTGRGEINKILESQGEEVCQVLTERLQQSFGNREPFVWTESILDQTRKPLPEIEELMDRDDLYSELKDIINQILSDRQTRDDLLDQLGWIWQDEVDHEKKDELRFQLDDQTLARIVEKAQELIIEGLLERGGTL